LATLLAVSAGLLALPAMASAATVSGTAFEDFNDNGERNSAPMVDSGVGGITVKAYRSDGTEVASTTTAADGSYSLNVPDGTGEVRVEFTDLPAGYQPARHGTNSGTTVQFVNGSATGVDVGVLQPFDYCQNNPQLAIACMRFGAHTDTSASGNAAEATIRIVPDGTADQTTPNPAGDPPVPGEKIGATFAQTGSVFGVAQPTGSNFLYSSAYTKRHSDWGPGGPGAIYRTDIAQANADTPNATQFFDVNELSGDPAGAPFIRGAGAGGVGTNDWGNDSLAWNQVGNSGLGNLSTNLDGSELYTVGLATGELIRIPIPADGSSPAADSVDTYPIPSPCTPAGDARPMGTGWHDGLLYVGGVCSMASVGNPPAESKVGNADMRVYVYTFDPATGSFGATPVLNTPLQSDRLCIGGGGVFPDQGASCFSADWHPWTSQSTEGVQGPAGQYSQPMLADISFVGDDLVLGIRDRSPDQLGPSSQFPNGGGVEQGMQAGYTLRACLTGGGYQLENDGACGGLTTSGPHGPGWGPGGGRFYWQQYWSTTGDITTGRGHDYAGQGGTLQIPGYPELRQASGYGANQCAPGMNEAACPGSTGGPHTSGGVLYLSNTNGARVKGYNLYTGSVATGIPTFGKSNGLGDLEALCEAAPIEIGNYVWIDPDRDGVQDPGETKLGGVKVELLDGGGSVVATTTTDGNGQYYFNESNVPPRIQPNTAYTVRIPLDQAVLEPYAPTPHDTSPQLRDSDGVPEGRFVVDRLTTGAAGHNDHTHDFGFTPRVWDQKLSKVASEQRVRLGEELTYTLAVENAGPDTSTAGGVVRDPVPAQFDVRDVSAGAGATCKVDDQNVRCELGAMAAGQKIEVKVRAKAIRAGGTVNVAFLEECCNKPPEPTPPVAVQVVKPKLGLTKGANKKVLRAGQKVTYTIRVRNPSDATLRKVRTCDDLPKGLAYVSSSPKAKLSKGKYCWTAKQLRAGQRKTYKLTVRALQGIRPGKKVNHATATSPDAKTKRAKRTVRVRGAQVAAGGVTG
jgi:uncharacterized repeat protein (TIGR01451 family)